MCTTNPLHLSCFTTRLNQAINQSEAPEILPSLLTSSSLIHQKSENGGDFPARKRANHLLQCQVFFLQCRFLFERFNQLSFGQTHLQRRRRAILLLLSWTTFRRGVSKEACMALMVARETM